MIPWGRVGFRLKGPSLETLREVLSCDENEVALPIFYRSGSADHEFRDVIVPIADIKPPLIRSVCLESVASVEEVHGGSHLLMSAQHLKPH